MCNVFAGIPRESYESQTRSVRLGGHSTSIRLEAVYWDILERLAESEGLSLARLLTELHDEVLDLHGEARNFSSLLRCVSLVHLGRTAGIPVRALEAERT
ncbi:ribbon-helix-helix domain-containing protein [Acuticoccus sp. I52.16.1]|uniref:ribbon-helix-helix domain-containing protein n=1 Tax=Acuticoccus sp. I52.16.1 TaxID=2928472 RepID=UPI001FD44A27|nr:ribbon-helix-helix domain-containing protein [Acuticoccus sp. I52.16.1]UOM35549.1 ribbon-helix-helix domain-containing protein [Acuticoccus sp. I52.16.1]